MSRHHDRLIRQAQEATRPAQHPRQRTEPMTHQEIESFIKGFGLSAPATRRIVAEWTADAARARSDGYDSGYQDGQTY